MANWATHPIGRRAGRPRLTSQPWSRTGENPPYAILGGMEETSASFEARSAPPSHPTNSAASHVYSLALGGLKASAGSFSKTTGAAPASQSVTSGFQPGALLLASYQTTAQTSGTSVSIGSFGLGAGDGTNEASSAVVAADAVSTAVVDGIDKTSKVFIKMNTPPLDAEADLASFSPTGFALNWTTNDSTASQICFLALGAP